MARLKILLPLMIIPCIVLSACSSFGRDADVDKAGITEFYKALNNSRMQVSISADFPERISKYRVEYTYQRDAESTIEILEPTSVSGIRISVAQGQTRLEFQGARLETGSIGESGITPLSALPYLMQSWTGGEVSQTETASHDGAQALLMVYSNELNNEEVEYRTWFDRMSYYPMYAEIFSDGRCVIRCEFETVAVNEQAK